MSYINEQGNNMSDNESIEKVKHAKTRITQELRGKIIGQEKVIEQIIISILSKGHCLLTGVPGLGKTLLVKSIAEIFDLSFKRIQFTPDLMPADIFGTDVIEEDATTGKHSFQFMKGPIFANMVLADEINRTPPKTQAALLEAMEEKHVTAGGKTYPLDQPFFVLATQNPIELEGTYPLPEAQLDRFMFKVIVNYPTHAELNEIVNRTILKVSNQIEKVLDSEKILNLRSTLDKVVVAEPMLDYAVRIVLGTHQDTEFASETVKSFVRCGASPRASQALIKSARVKALADGRQHVSFADIRYFAKDVLQHRILLNYDGQAEGINLSKMLDDMISNLKEDNA